MRNRLLFFLLAMSCISFNCFAGDEVSESQLNVIDSTRFTTIDEIIATQTRVMATNKQDQHWSNVWARKGFFNFVYGNSTLNIETPPTQYDKDFAKQYKSSISFGIQSGKRFALHRRPIANMALVNLCLTPLHLIYSHYNTTGDGTYNSSHVFNDGKHTYYDRAWNLAKHSINYGIYLGPQLSFTPFGLINNATSAHHLNINIYYQVGYSASLIIPINNKDADVNNVYSQKADMSSDFKGDFGHGLSTKFGFNLCYKAVGLGFENVTNNYNYKAIKTSNYGDESYKVKNSCKYFYLTFRF